MPPELAARAPLATDSPALAARVSLALLVAAIAAIPLQRHSLLPGTGGRLQLSDALVILATLTALPTLWRRRRELLQVPYLATAAYVLAALLSAVNAPDPSKTVLKAAGIGTLGAAMLLVGMQRGARARVARLCDAWLLSALVVAALTALGALAFYVLGKDSALHRLSAFSYGSLPPGNYPRVSGFFGNGNMYCNYLILTAGVLVARWPAIAGRWGTRAPWLALAIFAPGALFSLSTGLGGLGLGLALWCWRQGEPAARWLRRGLIAGGLAGATFLAFITVAAIVPPGQGDVPILGPLGDLSLEPSGRLAGWISTLETIRKYPLLGAGADELVAHIAHRWATQGIRSQAPGTLMHLEAHNVWLGIWAQMGVLALVAFAVLVAWLLRGLLRRDAPRDAFALGVALVAAVLYHGQFGSFEDARYLWPYLGLCIALRPAAPGSELRAAQDQVGQQAEESDLHADQHG